MTENNELERKDIWVDRDIEISDDNDNEIVAYLDTFFDVDKKFGVDTASADDRWLNMYGIYNPYEDTLKVKCVVTDDDNYEYFDYTPTESEAELIKTMIAEKIYKVHGQTPQEFCEDITDIKLGELK